MSNLPPTEVIREQAELIAVLLDERSAAVIDVLDTNRKFKEAKKKLERIDIKLLDVNRSLVEELPLFDRAALTAKNRTEPVAETSVAEKSAPARPDESWRLVPVAVLEGFGLSVGVTAKLKDAGLYSIGSIADWTASGKRLTDLAGIGETKADAIEWALAGFWEARRTEEKHLAGELGGKVVIEESTPDDGPVVSPADRPAWRAIRFDSLPGLSREMICVLASDVGETVGDLVSWLKDGNSIPDLEWGVDSEADGEDVDVDESDHKDLVTALRGLIDEHAIPADQFPREWIGCWSDVYVFSAPGRGRGKASKVYLSAPSLYLARSYAVERFRSESEVTLVEGELPAGVVAERLPIDFEPYEDRHDAWKLTRRTSPDEVVVEVAVDADDDDDNDDQEDE
jgi:hypothetical protein